MEVMLSRHETGIAVLAESQKPNPKIGFEQGTHKGTQLYAISINDKKLAGKLNPTLFVLDDAMVISSNTQAAGAIIDRHEAAADPFELPEHEGTLAALCRVDVTKLAHMADRYRDVLMKKDLDAGKPRQQVELDTDNFIFLLGLLDEATFYATHAPGRVDRVGLISFTEPEKE